MDKTHFVRLKIKPGVEAYTQFLPAPQNPGRCGANMAHIRHSRQNSSPGVQTEILELFQDDPSSLESC